MTGQPVMWSFMMRISTLQMTGTMQSNMMSSTNQMNQKLIQLSTGKAINKVSDDVLAYTQILGLKDESARMDSYEKNIGTAENALALQESMLGQMNDSLNRIRDLVLAIGGTPLPGETPEPELYDIEDPENPIAPPSGGNIDIAAYAQEIAMMVENLADVANTRSATGEYIFGGTQGDQLTVTFNEETGLYEVGGSESHRSITISDSQSVELGVVIGVIFGNGGENGEDNVLNELMAFVDLAMDPDTTADELEEAIADTLNLIDDTLAVVNQSLTKVGSSMNKLEMANNSVSERQMYNESMTGSLENIDFADAIIEFTMLQTQLQASQKAYGMVGSASLFNYI